MFTLAMSAGVLHHRLIQWTATSLGVGFSPRGPSRVSARLLDSRAFSVALQANFHGTSYPSVVQPGVEARLKPAVKVPNCSRW